MEAVTRRDLPTEFYENELTYAVYPEKFGDETWGMLHDLGMTRTLKLEPGERYPVAEPAGLLMMSLLADSCAGTTRARITDRNEAYAKLTSLMVAQSEGTPPQMPYEAVVPFTLNIINASSLSLPELIRFREREEKESKGYELRELRHRYVDGIAAYVRALTESGHTPSDREEVQRRFENELAGDLRNLRQELRLARAESLFSTPVITTAIITISGLALVDKI